MWSFRAHRKILGLQEDIEKLQRDFKALQLEWDDVYDKLRKAMGRVVKSRAIIDAHETKTDEPAAPIPNGPAGFLTDRQREIQQHILRRRAGGGERAVLPR